MEKFVVQQFIWPCPSMLIDQTRRPNSTAAQRDPGHLVRVRVPAPRCGRAAAISTVYFRHLRPPETATYGPRRPRACMKAQWPGLQRRAVAALPPCCPVQA